MNAAAAHAAFLMTVSAARMYWLLRHAQHVRDINIHKLHPLPENKNSSGDEIANVNFYAVRPEATRIRYCYSR